MGGQPATHTLGHAGCVCGGGGHTQAASVDGARRANRSSAATNTLAPARAAATPHQLTCTTPPPVEARVTSTGALQAPGWMTTEVGDMVKEPQGLTGVTVTGADGRLLSCSVYSAEEPLVRYTDGKEGTTVAAWGSAMVSSTSSTYALDPCSAVVMDHAFMPGSNVRV
jgi:hypothetical protein